MTQFYRIILLGPTGSGKSQLCNFICRDQNNSKFTVSDGLDSQTKVPQTETFVRKIDDNQYINIELIDSAGCSDSEGSDEENFKSLIEKLKTKKSVHLFILVFNITNRIDKNTRNYIKFIANTFTPTEFFNHLVIIFTNYKENPTDRDEEKKNIKTNQIIDIIKKTIGIGDKGINFIPKAYELDTELNKDGNFIEKFQATIDVILLRMQNMVEISGSVDTENIKYNNVKDRIKQEEEKLEKELREFEKRKEEEKKHREEEERRLKEERIKYENNKKLLEEKKIKDEKKRKEIEEEQKRLEEEKIRYEKEKKKNEEDEKRKKEEFNEKLKKVQEREEAAQQKIDSFDIKIRELDELIKEEEKKKEMGIFTIIGGGLLSLTGIGAIVGVPMMIGGTIVTVKSMQKIDDYTEKKKNLK